MASLDIPSEANDEDADIIFDYSSDENPYENPYTEYNFAQKRKKSYVDEDLQREFDYKPPTQTERYLYQQGKIRTKKNKWEQIPPQYIPKIPITRMDYDILNLDCETDIDEIIQDWNNRLSAQIQLTEELRVLNPRDLLNFIIHRTSGNVYRFIESLDELELSRIATTDAMTTFKNVVARIVQEFTGRIPGVEASNKAFREHAYWRLINLKICNINELTSQQMYSRGRGREGDWRDDGEEWREREEGLALAWQKNSAACDVFCNCSDQRSTISGGRGSSKYE
ncbi:hypothetical protein Tco_0418803 [Tanacetum coccineum]